jgi:nucleotide-binding universal stress UspA family protein
MPEYSNILFCTDFSHNADVAFEEASHIASLTGASLSLLHVIHGGVGETARAVSASQRDLEESAALGHLERVYLPGSAGALRMAVRRGNVTAEILEHAAETSADLIVIGARGIGRLEGFLGGGSIAEKVARNAKVPMVIVVPPTHD